MYIRRYSVAAFILIGLIGSFFYINFKNTDISIDIMGIHSGSLPLAFWVVISMVLLYLATVSHMLYYAIKGAFSQRRLRVDSETYVESLSDALLGRIERQHKYKTDRYKLFGSLIDNGHLEILREIPPTGEVKIDEAIRVIEKIERGEHVDIHKFHLSAKNPLTQKNAINAYNAGEIGEEQILNNVEKHSGKLVALAFNKYVTMAPLHMIEKYKLMMNKEVLFKLVTRINAKENELEISVESLIALINEVKMSEDDYIQLSVILAENMMPDERIKLFKLLSDKSETAAPAYLYTLFDLEMIAPAVEILENSQPDEFIYFKAYKALKDCNQNFSIGLFISQKMAI